MPGFQELCQFATHTASELLPRVISATICSGEFSSIGVFVGERIAWGLAFTCFLIEAEEFLSDFLFTAR